MGQVAGSKLKLESICGLALWCRHDTRVIDEDIQCLAPLQKIHSSSMDTLEGIEVHLQQLSSSWLENVRKGSLAFDNVANPKEKLHPCSFEGSRGLDANARGTASDESDFIGELSLQPFINHNVKSSRTGVAWPFWILVGSRITRSHHWDYREDNSLGQ